MRYFRESTQLSSEMIKALNTATALTDLTSGQDSWAMLTECPWAELTTLKGTRKPHDRCIVVNFLERLSLNPYLLFIDSHRLSIDVRIVCVLTRAYYRALVCCRRPQSELALTSWSING